MTDDPFESLRTPGSKDSKFTAEGERKPKGEQAQKSCWSVGKKHREHFLEVFATGDYSIQEALAVVGVSVSAYKQWRKRDRHFAAQTDLIRGGQTLDNVKWNGTHVGFAKLYFNMEYAPHHMRFINEMDALPPGGILMALMPPEAGKTTMYENIASEMLATNPNWRGAVASESLTISQKILGRVKHRMEPEGPFPLYVKKWGPFKPPFGEGRESMQAQPWGAGYFNVWRKNAHDERDYNLLALGFGSSIVSMRTDHLHLDDIQSLKTYSQTDRMEEWVRQDALSRPGEYGRTTIAGTRVAEDDIYSRFLNDESLNDIMRVVKVRAIETDIETGEQTSYWPERYSLEQLDRMRRKVGEEAWDRNYMQNPGASQDTRTFTDDMIESAKNSLISLHHEIPAGRMVYIGLDPALGGMNCAIAVEVTPDGKLIIRGIRETQGLRQNEQIMQELNALIQTVQLKGGRVSDVVIETMNFQKGLANDERLMDMQRHYGFNMSPHLTGNNKYDENIGIPSMCGSFLRGEIVIPWADDSLTRTEMEEFIRQLKAWRPLKRGSKLRQDRVMALWFSWVLWRQRWKLQPEANAASFKRGGLPWSGTRTGLVIPVGARP